MSDQAAQMEPDAMMGAAMALKEAVAKHRAAPQPVNAGVAPEHGLFSAVLANPAVIAFVENTAVDVLSKALALFQQYVHASAPVAAEAVPTAEAAPAAEAIPSAQVHLPGAP